MKELDDLIVNVVKEKKKIRHLDLIEMIENSLNKLSFVPSYDDIIRSIHVIIQSKRIINRIDNGGDIYLHPDCD